MVNITYISLSLYIYTVCLYYITSHTPISHACFLMHPSIGVWCAWVRVFMIISNIQNKTTTVDGRDCVRVIGAAERDDDDDDDDDECVCV